MEPATRPSPLPLITSYPVALAILLIVLLTIAMVWVARKIDRTGGSLTISLLIIITFIGVVTYCLVFSIPSEEINSTVVGGLATAFGAVVMHWLNRSHDRKDEPPKKDDDKQPEE